MSIPYRLIVPKVTPRRSWFCSRNVTNTTGIRNKVSIAASSPQRTPDIAADGLRHRDRHRAGVAPDQEEGEEELVPGQDQAEHRRRGDARLDLRQADPKEDLHLRAAVHAGRVRDLARDLVEEALHHPDRERQIEGGIEQDDPDIAAREPAHAKHDEDRDDEHVGLVAPQRPAREAVGRDRVDDQRHRDRGAGDEDAVEEKQVEAGIHRLATALIGAGEDIGEILEGRREDEFRRCRERVRVDLERGQDDPQHREEVGEADHRRDRGSPPARLADLAPPACHGLRLLRPPAHEEQIELVNTMTTNRRI